MEKGYIKTMKSTSLISVAAILLGGCATGTKFDQGGLGDLEIPSPALPGLSANGNPMDPQAQLPGSGGAGGGEVSDPQGTGGSSDLGPASTASSSSSVSSSSSGGGNPSPMACDPGMILCGDTCSDVNKDVMNCGSCGHPCKEGQFCSSGKCTVSAVLYVAGDDQCDTYLDGKLVASNKNWFVATKVDLSLTAGDHVVAVLGKNAANGTHPGAVILDLGYGSERIGSGSDWGSTLQFQAGWETLGGSLLGPVPPATHGDIFNPLWWNRDPVTFAAKNFPNDSKAMWIWSDGFLTDSVVYFRRDFVID